jgi:hypothetical protein
VASSSLLLLLLLLLPAAGTTCLIMHLSKSCPVGQHGENLLGEDAAQVVSMQV